MKKRYKAVNIEQKLRYKIIYIPTENGRSVVLNNNIKTKKELYKLIHYYYHSFKQAKYFGIIRIIKLIKNIDREILVKDKSKI